MRINIKIILTKPPYLDIFFKLMRLYLDLILAYTTLKERLVMKRQKILRGTPAPLFDRIIDSKDPAESTSHLLNEKGLKASIISELAILLNTRCTVRKVIYDDHMETIPFFGLPDFFGLGDFSFFDGSNIQDWPSASQFITTAIQAAEPRLENISVEVDSYDPINLSLHVNISAVMKVNDTLKEIHFPLALEHNPERQVRKVSKG
jgi:type VI secretion system lysozyme-like protein